LLSQPMLTSLFHPISNSPTGPLRTLFCIPTDKYFTATNSLSLRHDSFVEPLSRL
jgi:hypothetical protein